MNDGVPASEIALLYRVNAQSEAYEAALAALHIPFLVRGGERFFDRPEIREAMVLLRGAARSADVDRPAGLPAQVAEVMGCSVGTAKSQASRGLDRLRALIDTHDISPAEARSHR